MTSIEISEGAFFETLAIRERESRKAHQAT